MAAAGYVATTLTDTGICQQTFVVDGTLVQAAEVALIEVLWLVAAHTIISFAQFLTLLLWNCLQSEPSMFACSNKGRHRTVQCALQCRCVESNSRVGCA